MRLPHHAFNLRQVDGSPSPSERPDLGCKGGAFSRLTATRPQSYFLLVALARAIKSLRARRSKIVFLEKDPVIAGAPFPVRRSLNFLSRS